MTQYKVGYLIGSLSSTSLNRRLAKALINLAPSGMAFEEITYRELPLYTPDYDKDFPEVATRFKQAVKDADALLIVTPEYNRSLPGAFKTAIDWGTRPYGQNAFTRKPTAVLGTSPGAIGTAIAQQHLRSILGFCNAPQMNAPEAYIQFTDDLISEDGKVSNASTEDFLRKYIEDFHAFIGRVLTVLPREG